MERTVQPLVCGFSPEGALAPSAGCGRPPVLSLTRNPYIGIMLHDL